MIQFSENYKVNLPAFEGPLDLLLHLIKKNDIDPTNIPIASLLIQYMDYVTLMQELDIDMAGEFILMAAELTHIKSKMLLPDPEAEQEEGEDPRAELARRLMEYQRFKDAAAVLNHRALLGRDVFVRILSEEESEVQEGPLEGDSFKLLSAFNDILKRLKPEKAHEVLVERLSVTERIYQILDKLKQVKSLQFDALFEDHATKAQCVVTFLAVLELARLKMIYTYQSESLGPIHLVLKEENQDTEVKVDSEFDQIANEENEESEENNPTMH